MKKFLFITAITFIFFAQSAQADLPFIPARTMEAAREAGYEEVQTLPKYQVVRVGIGTNNFGCYYYDEITVFATAEMIVSDITGEIIRMSPWVPIKIKSSGDTYNIYRMDGTLVEQSEGPITISTPKGLLGVKDLKRAGGQALYRGEFEIAKYNVKPDKFHLVNVIEVEDYLKGVVPNEMPVRFGLEALKAQSVAARNYVLSPRNKAYKAFDVVDSVASQVYFGAGSEKPLATKAVEETEGIVAIYNWDLILAQYSSTAGGYTESFSNAFSDPLTKQFPSVSKPYLKAKPDILSQTPLDLEADAARYYKSMPDSFDIRSPYFRWTREWTKPELEKVLQANLPKQSATGFVKPAFKYSDKLGSLKELRVTKRGESGKVINLEIITTTGTWNVEKELVVRRLITKNGSALPSANVVFEEQKDDTGKVIGYKAFGGGFGHGVGLSQYGAGFMGTEMNYPFEKILQHYYDGITLSTKPVILSSNSAQSMIKQDFYAKEKYAHIIVDNKYQMSSLEVSINGKNYTFNLCRGLLPSQRVCDIDISNYIKKGTNEIIFYYPEKEGINKALRLYVELVKKNDSFI